MNKELIKNLELVNEAIESLNGLKNMLELVINFEFKVNQINHLFVENEKEAEPKIVNTVIGFNDYADISKVATGKFPDEEELTFKKVKDFYRNIEILVPSNLDGKTIAKALEKYDENKLFKIDGKYVEMSEKEFYKNYTK